MGVVKAQLTSHTARAWTQSCLVCSMFGSGAAASGDLKVPAKCCYECYTVNYSVIWTARGPEHAMNSVAWTGSTKNQRRFHKLVDFGLPSEPLPGRG